MKKNLFIVASPLQFLNALEAKEYFQTTLNILLLIYDTNENELDAEQKMQLLNPKDWDEVIHYNLGNINKHYRFFEQIKLIKSLQKFSYQYIFSGEFGIFHQAIMANMHSNNIYLLDDGTATIFIYEQLRHKQYFIKLSFSKKLRLMRYKIANLDYKIEQNINFFTTFDIQELPNSKVIKHNFSYLKAHRLQLCKKTNDIYILGQNLIEDKWIKAENYIQYITKIIEYFNESKIIYIPHRSEKITEDYQTLFKYKNFTLQKSDGPIEMAFIYKNIYPTTIISFFSSALFNLDKIFSDTNIYAIKIDENNLLSHQQVVQKCYTFFHGTNVQLVNKDFTLLPK